MDPATLVSDCGVGSVISLNPILQCLVHTVVCTAAAPDFLTAVPSVLVPVTSVVSDCRT